ncbi:S8 family serine peptidase [Streptomyces sp. NBC_01231]|nr:S8 family serine peptidase [Streptomyces sp. NBC_01231]
MTRTPRRRRVAVTTLASLLAGALTLTAATSPTFASNTTGNDASYGDGIYIVKLRGQSVAGYRGDLPGLKRTEPAAGKRLDAASASVEKYVAYLDDRRERVLDAVPGVETLYDYSYTFNGFAAELTGRQAAKLASTPGVVSVTRNTVTQPASTGPGHGPGAGADGRAETHIRTVIDGRGRAEGTDPTPAAARTPHAPGSKTPLTTRPAQFPDIPRLLGLSGPKGLWAKAGGPEHAGEGVIVGVVDTGFDPSNPMFAALPQPRPDAEAIARKWHGDCDPGEDPARKVTCNNKVIGAQWFGAGVPADSEDTPSPLDTSSHGTHDGSTAAGTYGVAASVPGSNAEGRLSGVAPAARLAFYKACWPGFGCPIADLTAAIDRAVADGVDVINYSVTGTLTEQPHLEALFNAAKAGVFIAAAANNGGPDSVHHTGPWVTTVAAATHDTQYTTSLVLGDGRRYTRVGLNPGAGTAPLVEAAAVRKDGSDAGRAALCATGTLDPAQAKGKIIVCDRGGAGTWEDSKSDEVLAVGGKGLVFTDTPAYDEFLPPYVFSVPTIQVGIDDAKAIHAYASQAGATARFTPSKSSHKATREITSFSSSGPDHFSDGDLLKPDIASFGQLIPAGVVPGSASYYPGQFSFIDGTSLSSPHIAGLAALLRQLHPDWSPMEIKSALMTTATPTDENGDPIGRNLADSASPLDYGAGLPRVTRATDPGLVYDSTSADWTAYVCAIGQKPATEDGTDACATATKTDPSDLNYPSIAVGDLLGRQTVTRTVTNVTAQTATYKATLQTPPGFRAEVTPKRLTLAPGASASYKVTFERTSAAHDIWSFGSLTLSDAHSHHEVTSPIALRSVAFSAPREATVTGTGSATLRTGVDWNGELTAKASLYTGEKTTGTLTGTDQADFTMSQRTNDAVVKHRVHVPAGVPFTRFAITSADHVPGSNLDLYAFDTDGNHVGDWAGPGSDEHVDLPPGDYDVYVLQYELPAGTTSQQYTLWSWKVGQSTPAVTPTITPAQQHVSAGDRPQVTVSWPDATRGQRYVGAVEYSDGTTTLGHTALTVTP